MRELIASGMIKDTDDLKIAASVYYEASEESDSASGAADSYEVTLKAKNYNCDEVAVDAMKFEDLLKWCDELVVPGYNGNEDVILEAPVSVRYSKTKSFQHEGYYEGKYQIRNCTFYSLRYTF